MRRTLALRVFLLLMSILCGSAEARSSQVVLSLQAPAERLPNRICLQVSWISTELRDKLKPTRFASFNAFAAKAAMSDVALLDSLEPPCARAQNACDECQAAPQATGSVLCMVLDALTNPVAAPAASKSAAPAASKSAAPSAVLPTMRDLFLKMDGVVLNALSMQGADLVMKVDVPDGSRALVSGLGGAYYSVPAHAVAPGETLAMPLRNRCLDVSLDYTSGEEGTAATDTTLTCSSGGTVAPMPKPTEESRRATVLVPESGAITKVVLHRGSTTYEGQLSDAATDHLKLAVTHFAFTWKKSCFVTGRRKQREDSPKKGARKRSAPKDDSPKNECPTTPTLAAVGLPCGLVTESSSSCSYSCTSPRPLEFPMPVHFNLEPPDRQSSFRRTDDREKQDYISWDDVINRPDEKLTSFAAKEERAFYLSWPDEHWRETGREVDAIEITTPDGHLHRLQHHADRIAVAELQCSTALSYRYLGRVPYRLLAGEVSGDRFDVPEAAATRQSIVLGIRGHGGVLNYLGKVDSSVAWAPVGDLELFALLYSRWVLTISGAFTTHPSVLTFDDESARWSSSAQVRTLVFLGHNWRPFSSRDIYLAPELGGGVATHALAADWSKTHPSPIVAARVRVGFDITYAVAVEFPLALAYETYVRSAQDVAGPHATESEPTVSWSAAVGLQWTNPL